MRPHHAPNSHGPGLAGAFNISGVSEIYTTRISLQKIFESDSEGPWAFAVHTQVYGDRQFPDRKAV